MRALVNFYVSLIRREARTIDDVPEGIRGDVQRILDNLSPEYSAVVKKEDREAIVNNEVQQDEKKTEDVAEQGEFKFIGNKESMIFHKMDCDTLPKDENRVMFECFYSLEEAIEAGFRGCKRCNPK